jgi:predicted permease
VTLGGALSSPSHRIFGKGGKMDTLLNAGSTMIILFIVIALGYLARKLEMIGDAFDSSLSKIIMNITCPATVLDSVLSNSNLPDNGVIGQVLFVSFVTFVPVIVLSLILARLYRVPEEQRGGHAFTITFGNVAFVGFAVVGAILGTQAVLYASIYNIISSLLLYSVGAWMIARSGSIKLSRREQVKYVLKNLFSVAMGSCVLALILALLHVNDFGIIGKTCSFLGAMTAPAAMLVVGSTLAKYKLGTMIRSPWAYVTTFARLIVAPALTYLTASFFISDPYLLATLTLIAAMPAAMMGTVMCLMYGGDILSVSQCMFLTTLFSILTIPIVTACVI